MLLTTTLERVFIYKDSGQEVRLKDPGDHFSAEAVLNFYAATYPALTTAKIIGPDIRNDEVQYRFESVMGVKG